ncbi:hypothetical protein H4218_006412 [Coemansia sp. IMI 209128]|nr:hypothetical protein H4218_006412 [Coemansia sp. IMI 209128]
MLVNCTAQFDGFDAYYDDVMGKIREFYNGYYIGRFKELTLEYQERKYLPVEVQLAPSTTPPISVALGDASFVDLYFEGNRFSKGAFLSICLQAGYLTRRTAQTVCIPNEELFLVWRNLLGELVFGEDFTQGPNELKRGQIVGELWRNNPKRLCDLVTSSHMVLVGHTNFKEKQFANHAANSFKVAALFGALSHPRGIATLITNTQFLREVPTGDGRCDMVLWLDSTTNAARVFGVVIEFKLIDYRKRDDGRYCERRALEGLSQIEERDYSLCLENCLERMDIGLAIGSSVAVARSKLYKRTTTRDDWTHVESL